VGRESLDRTIAGAGLLVREERPFPRRDLPRELVVHLLNQPSTRIVRASRQLLCRENRLLKLIPIGQFLDHRRAMAFPVFQYLCPSGVSVVVSSIDRLLY